MKHGRHWTPVAVGLAMAFASSAPAQQARCRDCDTTAAAQHARDFALAIQRVRAELASLNRRQLQLATTRSPEAGDSIRLALDPDVRRLSRELAAMQATLVDLASAAANPFSDDSLRRLLRDAEFLQMRLQSTFQDAFPAPKGWLGISYSAEARQDWSGNDLAVKHASYPVIVTVEPGSPAERAGLSAGDTMVSFNGQDLVSNEISMSRVLRPGAKLVVRVRRDGATREIPVVVGRRPESIYRVVITPDPSVAPLAPVLAVPAPGATPAPRAPTPRAAQPAAAPVPAVVATPVPEVWSLSIDKPAVAGAELARVDSDLGAAFGVDHGVLVLSVAPGTPAEQCGLHAGDVILRADSLEVLSPVAFGQAVLYARGRPVALQIIRKHQQRKLTLTTQP